MAQQMALFSDKPVQLVDDATGSIVYYPSVLSPSEAERLYEALLRDAPWRSDTRWMYDHMVEVPRLVARYAAPADLPPELRAAKQRVEALLHVSFTSVSLNFYRNGNDSVAWHSDRKDELVPDAPIALVSLGATRRMQLRTKARPRRTATCDLDAGSVFVMAGRAQEYWEHHVPKSARPCTARISVALRLRMPA